MRLVTHTKELRRSESQPHLLNSRMALQNNINVILEKASDCQLDCVKTRLSSTGPESVR